MAANERGDIKVAIKTEPLDNSEFSSSQHNFDDIDNGLNIKDEGKDDENNSVGLDDDIIDVRPKRKFRKKGYGRSLKSIERCRRLTRWKRKNLETSEERTKRLEAARNVNKRRLAKESPAERICRLAVLRENNARMRSKETEQQRERRLEKCRIQAKMRRANETPEQRAKRLQGLREAQAARRAREKRLADFAKDTRRKWEEVADLMNYTHSNDELRNFIFWEVMRLQEEAARHLVLQELSDDEGLVENKVEPEAPFGLRLFEHFMTTRSTSNMQEEVEEDSDYTIYSEPPRDKRDAYERSLKLAFDTFELRSQRLERCREHMSKKRAEETPEKRQARLEKNRLFQALRRANESPDEREVRLHKMRVAVARKREETRSRYKSETGMTSEGSVSEGMLEEEEAMLMNGSAAHHGHAASSFTWNDISCEYLLPS